MDMRKYKDRVRTLGSLTRCNKPLLAREGWYYTGSDRRVKCRACHVEINLGRFGRGIIEKHLDKSPDCKLARRRQELRKLLGSARRTPALFFSAEQEEKYPLDNPKVPAMDDPYRRGYTYELSYVYGNRTEMIGAGFYWAPNKEQVVCYYCGGSFDLAQVQTNAVIQHARYRPHCDYINRYLGSEVVQLVQEHFAQEEIPEELITEVKQEPAVAESKAEDDPSR